MRHVIIGYLMIVIIAGAIIMGFGMYFYLLPKESTTNEYIRGYRDGLQRGNKQWIDWLEKAHRLSPEEATAAQKIFTDVIEYDKAKDTVP